LRYCRLEDLFDAGNLILGELEFSLESLGLPPLALSGGRHGSGREEGQQDGSPPGGDESVLHG
jgi:hypothetical protein